MRARKTILFGFGELRVNKREMTTPKMHCDNPTCVDDDCHGECLALIGKIVKTPPLVDPEKDD
jgi:hypothetical protein